MADPGTLKRIDEPPGEETKGSQDRSRPATGAHPPPERTRQQREPAMSLRMDSSTPLTYRPESSVDSALTSSTASLMTTGGAVSSCSSSKVARRSTVRSTTGMRLIAQRRA
jgi:hypothetical protein